MPIGTTLKVITAIFLFCLLIIPVRLLSAEKVSVISAREVAEAFCKAEFEGDYFDRRFELIKYSPKREAKMRQMDFLLWEFDFGSNRLHIISSYQVLDVKVTEDKAVAKVKYRRLAKRTVFGGKIIPDFKAQDISYFNLIKEKNRWWVFDPPIPRVSKKVMIDSYRKLLKSLDAKWQAHASEGQWQEYYKDEATLKTLENLKD